jgi:hypothetical protein
MKLDDDARRLMDDNNFNDWWRDNPMPYYEAIKKYQAKQAESIKEVMEVN